MLKEDRFRLLIEEQRSSGLSIQEFCSNHSIPPSTFHYWKKKFSRDTVKDEFIPLIVKPTEMGVVKGSTFSEMNTGNPAKLELVFPNGTMLRVQHDLDLAHLRALIHLYD
jgi:transposase-like protein